MRLAHEGHIYVSRVCTGSINILHTGQRLQLTDFLRVSLVQLHTTEVVPGMCLYVNPLPSNALGGRELPARTILCIPRILSWAIRHRAGGRDNAILTPYWSSEASCFAVLAGLCPHSVCYLYFPASTLRLVAGRHDVRNLWSSWRGRWREMHSKLNQRSERPAVPTDRVTT